MLIRFCKIALALMCCSSLALAEDNVCQGVTTHEIQMLNKSAADPKMKMVFEPSYVALAPGDCVKFLPTSKGHNAETIKKMYPKGAKKFKSKINKEFIIKLKVEGLYGIKCTPHYQMGMVALIQVGEVSEESLSKSAKVKHRGKAKDRFKVLFSALE
jgi:pseudoazurin